MATREDFINKATSIHGKRYDYSKVVYKNSKTKVSIICYKHGVFEQTPDKHINSKCGCPMCADNVRKSSSQFIDKARSVHGDTYDYSQVLYVNNRVPVKIICCKHGVFNQSPSNHLAGKGCPKCSNNVELTTEEFIRKAISIHGDKYDYSKVDYHNNRQPVTIICKEHGSFLQTPCSHLAGCGCYECGIITRLKHRDEAKIHAKAVNTFQKKYGVSNPMSDESIRNKYKNIVKSVDVNNKRIATKRKNNSFNTSLSEYRLGLILKGLFGEDDVIDNYVSEVYPFKCDYYIKSRDLYIELNAHWSHGSHWYTKDDEAMIKSWQSKSDFYRNAAETFSIRDVAKRNIARQNSLNYVVFWKNDLSDAKLWVSKGCPDGRDWDIEYSWL